VAAAVCGSLLLFTTAGLAMPSANVTHPETTRKNDLSVSADNQSILFVYMHKTFIVVTVILKTAGKVIFIAEGSY